jgi:hypothetical protein
MSDEINSEKKLHVDEDWKSQVEAEKEAALHAEEVKQPVDDNKRSAPRGPLPPPSLAFLISTLYLQGTMSLGLVPNPMTGKAEFQPDQARHSIDMLTMIEQKTQGNRTPEESEDLEAALHELRLAFVTVRQN